MVEDQNSAYEEVTPLDQDTTVVDEQVKEEIQEEPSGQEEDSQERNFRALRKKSEADERRVRELEERIRLQDEFMKSLLSQKNQVQQQPKEVDEFEGISDEDYIPKGQVRKQARLIAREEFQALERERESARFHERLKSKYSDFDSIVNSETIAMLEKNEPEIASTIADLKDPYKMGLQTYNIIKSMYPQSSKDEKRHAKEVEKNIEKNGKTIQSPQAYNKRPMAQAFDITRMDESEKQSLYNEMLGFARNSPGY